MENKISTNYLLNKYSYCLYFLVSICSYKIILKENNFNTFLVFEVFITIAYVFWIFTIGSYHFFSQVKAFKYDRNTLMIKKSYKTMLLSNNDIDFVNFYPIVFMKGNKITIKIKIIIYTKEEFYFHLKIDKERVDISKIYDINYFYFLTNNFWDVVSKGKISLATSIFSF